MMFSSTARHGIEDQFHTARTCDPYDTVYPLELQLELHLRRSYYVGSNQ
jgi:hypothetical protein